MDGSNCINFLKLDTYRICMIYDVRVKSCSKDCKYYKRRPYNREKCKRELFTEIKEYEHE